MAGGDHNSGLANSFTDLMTSLAVIFILLLCASLNNAQQEGQNVRAAIIADLQRELQSFFKQGVEVKKDPRDPLGLIVLVPEGLLQFALNDDNIPQEGRRFLNAFIPKLASTMLSPRFRDDINSVVVEGHTDSSGTDAINLPLSQRRSLSVVMESLGVLDGDARMCFLKLLSASGRGSMEPFIDTKTGHEDMGKSRRVFFKIRVRSLEQKTIYKYIDS
ncbi:MAG: OmpA family protein [Pseudomonadota bacterium]